MGLGCDETGKGTNFWNVTDDFLKVYPSDGMDEIQFDFFWDI